MKNPLVEIIKKLVGYIKKKRKKSSAGLDLESSVYSHCMMKISAIRKV